MNKINRILSVILIFVIVFTCIAVPGFASTPEVSNSSFVAEKNSDNIELSTSYPKIGEPIKVLVKDRENEDFLYHWYINNIQIKNYTDTYTPVEDDLNKMVTVKVYDLNAALVGVENVFISSLPVIYIETKDRQKIVSKDIKIKAEMNIQGNDEFNSEDVLYNGDIEIKGRGNTTWSKDKKPYKIKLDGKSDLFGMGKNKHWVLLSNPFDTSNLRNNIAYQLSGKMGMNYQDGTWAELILNGEDVGIYCLTEHIRVGSTRTDITDWESVAEDAAKAIYKKNTDILSEDDKDLLIDAMTEDMSWATSDKFSYNGAEFTVSDYYKKVPDINGGYILEMTNITSEAPWFKTDNNVSIEINTPETLSEDMQNYISSYIQAFEDALMADDYCTVYNGQKMRYTEFIDLDSFAKGVLINDLFQNGDFGYRSTYFYKDVNGRLCYGPVWDMDWCFNTNADVWTSGGRTWIARFLKDPVFMKKLRDIYWEYRYTAIYDVIKEGGEIDTACDKIYELSVHNDKLWKSEVEFEENAADYRFRIQDKINWLDSTLKTVESAYSFSDMVKSEDIGLTYDNNTLSISAKNTAATGFSVYVNGEFSQDITDLSDLDNIKVNASDDDIISVVAYSGATVLGGNYICGQNYITALKIDSEPDRTVYSAGESIDLTGLKLTAVYKDGSVKPVKPDLVYTRVTDSLDTQLYCYDKVTDKCGSVVLVLVCGAESVSIPLTVEPKEDYELVKRYINRIPADTEDVDFVKYTAEAWEQYEALSESAKAAVDNYEILSEAIDVISSKADESMVIDCYHSIAMRDNARNNFIIAAKAGADAVVLSFGNNSNTTFKRTSNKLSGIKKLGDIEFWTVRGGLSSSKPSFTVSARYSGVLYTISGSTAQLITPEKIISDVNYPSCIIADKDFGLSFNCSDSISKIKLTEGNETLIETDDFSNGVACKLSDEGNHSVTLYYMSGGRWFEYDTYNMYVREADKAEDVYYSNFDSDDENIKVVTGTDINDVRLISETDTISLTGIENGGYKIWSGTKPSDDTYSLFIGEAKSFNIQPVKTEFFVNGEITKADFSAYITDAFNNTVKISNFVIESVDTSSSGVKTVTASYNDLKASCTIEIKNAELVSIGISKLPDRQSFYLLEELDTSGLVLEAVYSDGSSKYISADENPDAVKVEFDTRRIFKSDNILTHLHDNTIKVKCAGMETSYQVNVSFNLFFIIRTVFRYLINVLLNLFS